MSRDDDFLRAELIDERGKNAFTALVSGAKVGIVAAEMMRDLALMNNFKSDLRLNILQLIDEAMILLGKAETLIKSIDKIPKKKKTGKKAVVKIEG